MLCVQAPAKAPAKAPVMGLHHEPEDDFQCRTHQNLYFSERENPALSGFSCCSPDDTVYIGNSESISCQYFIFESLCVNLLGIALQM